MKFILFFVLPLLAICFAMHLLAKRRAVRLMEAAEAEERRQTALFNATLEEMASRRIKPQGGVFSHAEAKIEMERRKREARKWCDERNNSNNIMNPLHPLSPLNPIGFNGPHTSVTMANDERPHHQACYTGSDPHESNRHSSWSDWGSSSSSDSSSYSSSDSGSSSSGCD